MVTPRRDYKKRHHYVPLCFLQNFTDDSRRLWAFDKQKREVFGPTNPRNVASETHLYRVCDEDVDYFGDPLAVEDFFAEHVEPNFCPLVRDVLAQAMSRLDRRHPTEGKLLYKPQKEALALDMAFQVFRTPSFMDHCVTAWNIERRRVASAIGVLVVDEVMRQLASTLVGMTWVVGINCTDRLFYTSDTPVVWSSLGQEEGDNRPVAYGAAISFPLSSKVILRLFERKAYKDMLPLDGRVELLHDPEVVREANRVQAAVSHRYVFSADGDFRAARQVCTVNRLSGTEGYDGSAG